MTSCVELELPFPVSVNQAFSQNKRTGRRFISQRYKRWRTEAGWVIRAARLERITYPVDIKIELTPVDHRRRDADNFQKGLLDSLVESGLLEDDSSQFIRDIQVSWTAPDRFRARATVTISPTQNAAGGLRSPTKELQRGQSRA